MKANPVRGSNFSLAFLALSRHQKQALEALYAFCRTVDDIADEIEDPKRAKKELDRWKEILQRVGHPSVFDPPIAHELARALNRYPICRDDLEWILKGVERDLTQRRYQTFSELLEYCDAVASAVGLATLAIFGASRDQTLEYAKCTGRALQLTNILRDVASDGARDRIYLPLEDLERFSYREKDLLRGCYDSRFVELMKFESARAREFYQKATEVLPKGERKKLLAAEIMRRTYEALLRRIEQKNFNVFPGKIRVPAARKMMVVLSVFVPDWLKVA